MRDYEVLNPVKRDGKIVRSGTVPLSDTDGAQLTRDGFVRPSTTTEAADPALDASNETGGESEIRGADSANSDGQAEDSPGHVSPPAGGESPAGGAVPHSKTMKGRKTR